MKNLILLFTFYISFAQPQKINTKDFNLVGKVKTVLETAEKQGDLITEKEKNDKNTFYNSSFQPIIGQYTFNEGGNIIQKRGFPNIDQKTIYVYSAENQLITKTIYNSNPSDSSDTPISEELYGYNKDTIMITKTNLEDKADKPFFITQVYKNQQLVQEFTAKKNIDYYYDNYGTLIKKVGFKKNKPTKNNSETYQISYENDIMVSNFCPEKNILKTYYANGLLKSTKTDLRFQENVYTFDQNGNWITNTVSLNGKPSIKYYRIVDYFE